jgi:hypothetical protein
VQPESASGLVVLGIPEVPLEEDVFTLGIAYDPLAVAPELRVVGREQDQACHHPGTEVVDHLAITEVGLDLPVRGHGAQIHDAGVATRWFDLGFDL